jgi:hypothetical protein
MNGPEAQYATARRSTAFLSTAELNVGNLSDFPCLKKIHNYAANNPLLLVIQASLIKGSEG